MKAKAIEDLPLFSQSDHTDFCVLVSNSAAASQAYLTYECHRDFLSTPRAFAIVTFDCPYPHAIDLDVEGEYPCFTYDNASGLCDQQGFFIIDNSEANDATNTSLSSNEDNSLFVMLMAQQALEINCQNYRLLDTLYHCVNAQSAFFEFIRK